MDRDQAEVEALRGELTEMFSAIQAGLATADRILGIAGTILVGGFTLALSGYKQVYLGLSLPGIILLTYQTQVYADVKLMRTYRASLEKRLNRRLGRTTLMFEEALHPLRGSAYSAGVRISGGTFLILILFAFLSGVSVCRQLSHPVKSWWTDALPMTAYLALNLFALLGLFLSLSDKKHATTVGEEAIRHYLAERRLISRQQVEALSRSESVLRRPSWLFPWRIRLGLAAVATCSLVLGYILTLER